MSAVFRPSANTKFAIGVGVLIFAILAAVGGPMLFVRTPFYTRAGYPVYQPVQFDHRHHVADDGIDCRYCHQTVETSSTAGFPSVGTCMNCHAQIWNKSPLLAPVRDAYFAGLPIRWERVHRLPDFVYFDHAIHVAKGVGCPECHGRVDRMPLVMQTTSMTMGFCLSCHRDPAPRLRPREAVFDPTWKPPEDRRALGLRLVRAYDVHARTSCTTCHR